MTGRPLLRQVLGNAGWLAADRLLRLALGVFLSAWTARHFGPAQFGLLNLAQALLWIISACAALGLETVVVRDLVRMPGRAVEILASALALRLAAALAGVAACVAVAGLLRPGEPATLALVGVLALGLLPQALDVVEQRYQASMRARPVILLKSTTFLLFAAVRALVLWFGGPLLAIAAASTAEVLCTGLLLAGLARQDGALLQPARATRAECLRLLRQGWPLALSALAVALYMRLDQLMLGKLAGDAAVGVFSAAVRLSEAWYFVPQSLMAATAPVLAAAYVRSGADYAGQLRRFGQALVRIALVAALALSLLAGPLMDLVFGPAYAGSARVLVVHAWTGVFVCLGLVANDWLLNAGLARFTLYHAALGAGANFLLNLWLIPAYGAVGAAVATLAGYSASAFLLNAATAATRPVFRLQLRTLGWN